MHRPIFAAAAVFWCGNSSCSRRSCVPLFAVLHRHSPSAAFVSSSSQQLTTNQLRAHGHATRTVLCSPAPALTRRQHTTTRVAGFPRTHRALGSSAFSGRVRRGSPGLKPAWLGLTWVLGGGRCGIVYGVGVVAPEKAAAGAGAGARCWERKLCAASCLPLRTIWWGLKACHRCCQKKKSISTSVPKKNAVKI